MRGSVSELSLRRQIKKSCDNRLCSRRQLGDNKKPTGAQCRLLNNRNKTYKESPLRFKVSMATPSQTILWRTGFLASLSDSISSKYLKPSYHLQLFEMALHRVTCHPLSTIWAISQCSIRRRAWVEVLHGLDLPFTLITPRWEGLHRTI